MRPYELMIVIAPDVPEEEIGPMIDNVGTYITRFGGEIIAINRDSPWGRRRLAYTIRYNGRDIRDGFYVLYNYDAEPTAIAEIDREIRLNEKLIRHLTTALDKPFVPVVPEAPVVEGGNAPAAAPVAEGETVAPVAEEVATAEAPAAVVAGEEAPAAEEAAPVAEEVTETTEAPATEE